MKEQYRIICFKYSDDNKSLHIHSIETQDTKVGAESRLANLASCLLETLPVDFNVLKYNSITGPYGKNHLIFIGSPTKHEYCLEYYQVQPYENDEYFYRGFFIKKCNDKGSWLYHTIYSTRFIDKPFDKVLYYIDEFLAIKVSQNVAECK